ncbi:hypothetical protein Moror_15731 [Moniliophthora roreri MCA 2997]|uniref:Uncharacterized protein n=1 Tax=Moniliophthora roreri (strain MCA 2997) TaxID=1381753 RepID=V2WDV4_MONRO|nr:hypothetical protein Moror_15731 [Moniliophthora roreri MCA 2997]
MKHSFKMSIIAHILWMEPTWLQGTTELDGLDNKIAAQHLETIWDTSHFFLKLVQEEIVVSFVATPIRQREKPTEGGMLALMTGFGFGSEPQPVFFGFGKESEVMSLSQTPRSLSLRRVNILFLVLRVDIPGHPGVLDSRTSCIAPALIIVVVTSYLHNSFNFL